MDAPQAAPVRTAVVIGGTRRIGRWVSETLLARGCRVHAIYRRDSAAAQQFLDWAGARDLPLQVWPADAADANGLRQLVASLIPAGGALDALICSAGPSVQGPIAATPPEQLERLWRDNLGSVHNAVLACLPFMPAGARIVSFVIPGLEGARAYRHVPLYAACKAALLSYSRSLARELAPRGISVNCIALGITDQPAEGAPDMLADALKQRQLVTQAQLAAALNLLLDPDAGLLTGSVLNLSGGFGL